MKKWILVLAMVLFVAMSGCSSTEEPKMQNVSNEAFKQLMQGDVLLLDVRTLEEYEAGHIDDATLIPVGELEARIDEVADYKDKNVLVYCRSGNRSVTASTILLKNGFTQVYNLKSGFSNWESDITK